MTNEIHPLAQRPVERRVGQPLDEVKDIDQLRATVEFLWDLLDNIDTASDMAKGNDKAYREYVENQQSRRHQRVTSDGYNLFMVPNV